MDSLYIHDISKSQGRLFAYACENQYDMHEFARIFMNSELANLEMDSEYYWYNCSDGRELEFFLKEELPKNYVFPISKEKDTLSTDIEVARWIGFMYRYIALTKKIASREVYKQLSYTKMTMLWIGGHTLPDEEFLKTISI